MVYLQYGLPAEQILCLVLELLRLGPVLSYTPTWLFMTKRVISNELPLLSFVGCCERVCIQAMCRDCPLAGREVVGYGRRRAYVWYGIV
jgi:hypothetical protein